MRNKGRLALVLWLLVLALSAWELAARTRMVADLSAFLPRSATPTQQVLLEQMRSGAASRVMLIALRGAPEERLAAASRGVVVKLRASGLFASVQNGDAESLRSDREAFMRYRYVLSPEKDAERFTSTGLRAALESALGELAAQPGSALARMLPSDPTGEVRRIVERLPAGAPEKREGVWFSADGERALLVAETHAGGFDAIAQQKAIAAVRDAARPFDVTLETSGAGVFAATSREAIERDAWLLSLVSGALVLLLLLRVYRSPRPVALCFVPVATGLAVGAAVVSVAFGQLHAITLGFGATLIGEAVDYPSYACLNARPGESVGQALARIWPTLRLAVLTTALGALTMLLSSFAGLAQLGLFTMSGVLAGGMVTRYVVPALAGPRPVFERVVALPARVEEVVLRAKRFAPLVWAIALGAAVSLVLARDNLWEDDLQALSPVPERLKAADRNLRREIGAPDVRHLVVVRAADREAALEGAEALEGKLDDLVRRGAIGGYDLVTRYVPSRVVQEQRLAALPEGTTLKLNLHKALEGLPFQRGVFEPFLRDVEQSRRRGPLGAEDLRGTAVGMKVQSLVLEAGSEWLVLVPLYGVADARALAGEVPLLDLKAESERLLASYRHEALRLCAVAGTAIVLVLALGLRQAGAVVHVILPVVLALVIAAAALQLAGQRLTVFHLIAMLLVMGIGLNYALFFDHPESRSTLFALLMTCATTLLASGTLAFSANPVLQAIGVTVTVGAVAAFVASAALNRR
jgi:predicted exporter